ncbi:hypothetical protein Ct9H90mP29_05090 [bacterium]|nr:MAG: hypothetical protein Ct9H90mP29_05090 [bacterium]
MIWMARRKKIHTNIFSARVKVGSPKLKPVVKQFYRAVYSSLSSIYTVSEKDMEGINVILGKNIGTLVKVLGNPRYDMVKKTADDFTMKRTDSILDREKRIIIGISHGERMTIF